MISSEMLLVTVVVGDFSGADSLSFSLFLIGLSNTNFVFRAVSTSVAVLRTAFFVTLLLDEDAELEFFKSLSFST